MPSKTKSKNHSVLRRTCFTFLRAKALITCHAFVHVRSGTYYAQPSQANLDARWHRQGEAGEVGHTVCHLVPDWVLGIFISPSRAITPFNDVGNHQNDGSEAPSNLM